MSNTEKIVRTRARRGQLQRTALAVLKGVGVIGLAIAAPNTLQLLAKLDPAWMSGADPSHKLRSVTYQLKRKGLIEWVNEKGRIRMRITDKGRVFLQKTVYHGESTNKPKRWDGQWRLVIFDIEEKRRGLRNRVRQIIAEYGFVRLQDSIWAYPYDCEEVITLLKADLSIGKNLLYIIASSIEYDRPLRDHFKLPAAI